MDAVGCWGKGDEVLKRPPICTYVCAGVGVVGEGDYGCKMNKG